MTSIIQDVQALAQQELNDYIRLQAQEIAPEVEIDGVLDVNVGHMYRVWFGTKLLGNFYRAQDGAWFARISSGIATLCDSSEEAQSWILQTSGLTAC